MTPAVALEIDGEARPGAYRDRLQAVIVRDESGIISDTVELAFDDHDGRLAIPERGHRFQVSLGYGDRLTSVGRFFVDDIFLSSSGTMRLVGKGFDTMADVKSTGSRVYAATNIKALLEEVGRVHKLKVLAAEALARLAIVADQPMVQRNESAIHFMSRISEEHRLTLKLQGDTILALPKGAGLSVSGKPLPSVLLTPKDVSAWEFEFVSRPLYGSVEAECFDLDSAQSETVTMGSGQPVFRFRQVFDSVTRARQAVAAKFTEVQRAGIVGTIEMQGNTSIMSESPVELRGFRQKIDGPWIVSAATHTVNPGASYRLRFACERREP